MSYDHATATTALALQELPSSWTNYDSSPEPLQAIQIEIF